MQTPTVVTYKYISKYIHKYITHISSCTYDHAMMAHKKWFCHIKPRWNQNLRDINHAVQTRLQYAPTLKLVVFSLQQVSARRTNFCAVVLIYLLPFYMIVTCAKYVRINIVCFVRATSQNPTLQRRKTKNVCYFP